MTQYYDALAPYYRYVYKDWDKSVVTQARDLDSIIRDEFGGAKTVLDVSAGIGTQSIGLAELGYDVTASDTSKEALELARKESERRGLSIDFKVADMRELSQTYNEQFDIILSADNSVPHLLGDVELLKAFREFYAITKPGGGFLITVRDYAKINPEGREEMLVPRHAHHIANTTLVLFDHWEFGGEHYNLNTYIVEDTGGEAAKVMVLRSRYYCVPTERLRDLLLEAGFCDVKILNDGFYQPVLVGRKSGLTE